jgi:chromosome segregation protein
LYLKSLRLTGFKTFADSTVLDMPPGIIGIVGPNGSGKSNIADAIQWALGEQSVRNLRGAVLTDVIFAGSDERRATNMAEVILTLDNADGALNLAFDEIAIERRAFRNNESEYLINRTRCRLRDIQELFLDTGVSRGSYSIIGQNDVDRVLSARPEDRRALFEEAAGTARYRSRRNDVLHKLAATQGNLDRVTDIIAELSEQLEPMAAQAEAAREYRGIADRLRELTLGLLGLEHGRRRGEMGKLEHELAVARADIEKLSAEATALEADETALRHALNGLEEAIDTLRQENDEVAAALASATADRRVGEERRRSLAGDLERLDGDREALVERLAALPHELAAAEAATAANRERIAEVEARRAEADARRAVATSRFEEAAAASEARARETARIAARRADLQAGLRNAALAREERFGRLEDLSGELCEVDRRVADLETRVAELAEAEERGRAALAEARDGVTAATAALAGADEALEARRTEEAQGRREADSLAARLATLRELHAQLHGIAQGAQTLLHAGRDGLVAGIVGTVADAVTVPRDLEAAVAAALGERVHYVVTSTHDDALAALAHLVAAAGGRATLLPAAGLSVPEAPAPPTGTGVRGVAADLCTCGERYGEAVRHLLGRVVIVDDRAAAERVLREGGGAFAAATLAGECFLPSGEMAGGAEGSRAEDPLARANEIAELDARMADLSAQGEARAAARQAAEAARRQADEALRAARGVVDEARAALEALSGERAAVGARVEAVRRDRGRLLAERESLMGWCTENDARIAGLREELAELPDAGAEGDDGDPAGGEDELGELARRRDAAAAEVGSLDVELADLRQQLRTHAAECQRIAEERARAERRVGLLDTELARVREGLGTTESAFADLDERIGAATAKQEQLASTLEERSRERTALRERIAEAADLAKRARRAVPDLQARQQEIEVRRARNETALAGIEERLAEEYEADLAEALARAEGITSERGANDEARALRNRVRELGDVNLGAVAEYDRLAQRHDFLIAQRADLEEAQSNLKDIIAEIDQATREQFVETFEAVAVAFRGIFSRLFSAQENGGGHAEISLTDPNNILETGIEINVRVPGKRVESLVSLSGGERALTAISLLFAMLKVKPPPFCVLDEIDAALDESNTTRFADLLRELSSHSQFIVITHARGTMEACDVLFGVTMQQRGVSRCISVTLSEAETMAEDEGDARA